jgi:predicted aspartyl protease
MKKIDPVKKHQRHRSRSRGWNGYQRGGRSYDRNPYRHRSRNRQDKSRYHRDNYRLNTRIDFKALGLGNVCLRCGGENHFKSECRVNWNKLKCKMCDQTGHVEKVCFQVLMNKTKKAKVKNVNIESDSDVDSLSNYSSVSPVRRVTKSSVSSCKVKNNKCDDKHYASVELNGKKVKMEIDSGSRHTLMSVQEFEKLNFRDVEIVRSSKRFQPYVGQSFSVSGKVFLKVRLASASDVSEVQLKLYLVNDREAETVLGREWMKALGLKISQVKRLERDEERSCRDAEKDYIKGTVRYLKRR